MKKLIILLIFTVACCAKSEAQSMLKVSLADRTPINVSVDGRYFNKRGATVTVGDLPPGRHRLQIFETIQDRKGRAREEVIYEGSIRTSNGFITLFVFDANTEKTDIEDQDINTYTANNPLPPANNNNGNAYGNNGNYNQGNNDNNDQNNGNYNNNNAPVASPVGTLTDDKITSLKDKVATKLADTQKMEALKEDLKSETFTTAQVGTMMGWFIFESSKVDFAKWAYAKTVDQGNYSTLENSFSYKNSQDDLDSFLKKQK